MTCLGPYELNIIRRKIIDKLYLFSPRTLTFEKLRFQVDNPLEEDFAAALDYLLQEKLVAQADEGLTLTQEGTEIYEDQGKFNEYFPLADIPRTNFG